MKVFLLSTPSQAFFLLKSPGFIDTNSILIILKGNSNNHIKILSYLDRFNWNDILVWDTAGIEHIKNYYKIIKFKTLIKKIKTKYGSLDQVFIGSYDNLFQLTFVAEFENTSEIFLLYDGLQMVSVSNARISKVGNGIRSLSWIFKIANLRKPKISHLTFISPLILNVSKKDRIINIKNETLVHPILDMNLVYIVGQPLVDIGIVSLQYFITMLTKIKRDYSKFDIVYIPHPMESSRIKSKIKNHFKILEINDIFEEYYISCETQFAGTIISFFSSVLINMHYLSYPSNIIAYKISKDNIIRESNVDDIEMMYVYFNHIKSNTLQVN